MQKDQLRLKLKQERLKLKEAERLRRSQIICDQLWSIDWSGMHTLHSFRPMLELGEVNITPFITKFISYNPKLHVLTSEKINAKWNIVSWQDQTNAEDIQFDAILVPMLGFDLQLHRIGYGGGYYDNLLASQPHARRVGVSYESGKVSSIPVESHDIALDLIVTDQHIYSLD
jgi:5,10-methenyltetrahydrofolate synthetase